MNPQITLDQWRALITVVDAGGYAQAANKLNKSQSAVTYAVQKIESLLNVKVFEIHGRKAYLTPTGQMLYRRALSLISEASDVEIAAHRLSAGWEAEIYLAVEILFPSALLLTCLQRFSQDSPRTRIDFVESVLSGTSDALLRGDADMVITPHQPVGFLGELLMRVKLIAVAHIDHPLHHYGRELISQDLKAHRHIVVRDSGSQRDQWTTSVEVDQRWTVSNIQTSIQAVSMGLGFAWLPALQITAQLNHRLLAPLPLKEGGVIETPLYLIFPKPDFVGPGVKHLAGIIRQLARSEAPCYE